MYRVLTPIVPFREGLEIVRPSLFVCGRPCREITLHFFVSDCARAVWGHAGRLRVLLLPFTKSSKFTLFSESSLQWRHPGTVCAARNIPAFAQVTFLPLKTSSLTLPAGSKCGGRIIFPGRGCVCFAERPTLSNMRGWSRVRVACM